MNLKNVLALSLTGFSGLAVGVIVTLIASAHFVAYANAARLIGDSTQDLALFEALQSKKYGLATELSKARLSSSLIGLSSDSLKLDSDQRKKAKRIFERSRDLGVASSEESNPSP